MTISLAVFFVSIFGILLSNIFPGSSNYPLSFFLISMTPFLLFLLTAIEKKKINIPIRTTIIYVLFLIFTSVSIFFSADKEISIKLLFIYISGYLFFIFSFNNKKILNRYFGQFLVGISAFSCLIFGADSILHLDLFNKVSLFYNYGHYQIGNLLVFGLLSIFPNPLFLIFFIFILFSYSRTAHLSLMTVFMIKLITQKLNKLPYIIGLSIISISLLFVVLKTNYISQASKQLFSGRNIYYSYAISSIKELPLFGIGPGNFAYAVFKKQVNSAEFTDQAENIILQVFSENGILAGIFFVLFVFLIFRSNKKNTNFLMFLALTLMFMIDLSYSFNFFLILWFILGGLVLDSDEKKKVNIIIPSSVIFVGALVILLSQTLLKVGLWNQSIFIYPLQKDGYRSAIKENILLKDKEKTYYYLQRYDQIFGRSTAIFEEINYYSVFKDKNKIAELYERLLWFRTFVDSETLNRIWHFYVNLYGVSKGNEKMADILKQIKNSYLEKDKKSDFYKQVDSFCIKTYIGC
jgi:O-antigen ligase